MTTGIDIREGIENTDFDRVHGWLSQVYWSPGIAREKVIAAAEGSALIVNAYLDGVQVGYLRGVSDKVTFGWISDVIVDEAHRGKGVGKAMVQFVVSHPEYLKMDRWILATASAHGLYEQFGFSVTKPNIFMHRMDPEYQKLTGF